MGGAGEMEVGILIVLLSAGKGASQNSVERDIMHA